MWQMMFVLLILSQDVGAGNVWLEVEEWKDGDSIPRDLTITPDYQGDDCGLMPDLALHSIGETQNFALLRDLVLGKEATGAVFNMALGRLLEKEGLPQVRSMLLDNGVLRKEHNTLIKTLSEPVAQIYVAQINDNKMSRQEASKVLERLAGLLDAGTDWEVAYRTVADENPDTKRNEIEGMHGTTLVTYKYSGWLTMQRMDVQSDYEVGIVPESHLRPVFEHGSGNLFLEGYDGLYLYRVVEIYKPEI